MRRWAALVAWMAAIYLVSDRPDLPHAPDPLVDLVVKKALHAAAYGVLAVLWLRALDGHDIHRRGRRERRGNGNDRGERTASGAVTQAVAVSSASSASSAVRVVAVALALTLLYAIGDEWHQAHVPGRTGRAADVVVDGLGAAAALGLWTWATRDPRGPRPAGGGPAPGGS